MLQGTLDSFSLVDILQFLARAEKTGGLHVRGEDTGVVYFHQGQVTFAAPRAGDTLGEALVRSGLLAEEAWRTVVDSAGERSLGEALAWSGAIDADRLRVFLEQHVEEALFDQLLWRQGEFQFRADEQHPLGHAFAFPVPALLAKVQGRLDVWTDISRRIPSLEVVVTPVPALPAGHGEVTLTAEEWRLVVAVDGRRTVEELARVLGQGTFQTCQALHGLLEAGLVVVVGAPVEVAPHPPVPSVPPVAPVTPVAPVAPVVPPVAPTGTEDGGRDGLHRDLVERLITAVKDL